MKREAILSLFALLCAVNRSEARSLAKSAAQITESVSSKPDAPSIDTLLKPEIYQRVTRDREIVSYANLKKEDPVERLPPIQAYSFYAAMSVRAGLPRTREILTDYQLYSKLIPYVDEARYDAKTHLLDLQGGIWKWKLHSVLRFDERSDRWIHFQIIMGHFSGLSGDIFFEPTQDSRIGAGTLVYLRGSQQGTHWPPAFIIEQGAQIVFEFTARRMRSYVESSSSGRTPEKIPDIIQGPRHDDKIPEPRSHL